MQSEKQTRQYKDSKISQQNHITQEICENGNVLYNCTACRKIFRSRSQKYYHLNCNQLEDKLYKCEHCEKSFARISQWKYHIESHLSPVNECLKCQKRFSNPLALKKHIGLHNVEPKFCPHCDKTFKKKISLDQHIAAQHLNQLQYGCANCSKKYASKSSLQLHLQTHEEKRFECSFCGKFFQRNSILNVHLKRHYNSNRYICTVCDKVFSESGALARHRKMHEGNIMQYHCKLCDKNILRKDNMTRHLNTIHPEEKFENIVDIIKPAITYTNKNSNRSSIESEECLKYNCKEENKHLLNTEQTIVIIENKLLQKPFELKDSVIEPPNKLTNNFDNIVYPLINQIKVIKAVPTYEKEIIAKGMKNISQECKNTTTKNLNRIHSEFKDQENNLNKFVKQTEEETRVTKTSNNQEHFQNTSQIVVATSLNRPSITNYELPKTQTISSVIRSVGNVKKNLTTQFVAPVKSINKTSMEYKHKKYCHNNYNIDLYRKILGCDEEEEDVMEIKNQQLNSMDMHLEENSLKSLTPVHWRKSFKNSYETSSL